MSNIVKWIVAAATALGLAGCMTASNMPGGRVAEEPVKCGAGVCRIPVGYQCFIFCRVVVADEIVVQDPARRFDNTLVWELPSDSSLHFASDGIRFEDTGFRCTAQPVNERVADGYIKWQCTNNGKPGRYKYWVHLEWHGVPVRLDPFVFNQ